MCTAHQSDKEGAFFRIQVTSCQHNTALDSLVHLKGLDIKPIVYNEMKCGVMRFTENLSSSM